jgi:hypothetical protein
MDHCAVIDTTTGRSAWQCRRLEYVWVCVLVFGQFSPVALAQDASDPMEVCFRLTDASARFSCYDHEMQRRHAVAAPRSGIVPPTSSAAAASTANAATTGVTAAAKRPIDDTIGLDGKQLILKRKAEGVQPQALQPVVAAIATLKPLPGNLYYFELDNGQVWESTDSEPNLFLGRHETVTLKPGILGAFFLKTPEGNSIRVHRVR